MPAAVIIIGIAFSKFANDSITALYPARFAWDDSMSIDCALVILEVILKKTLIFFLNFLVFPYYHKDLRRLLKFDFH